LKDEEGEVSRVPFIYEREGSTMNTGFQREEPKNRVVINLFRYKIVKLTMYRT
jgi:hypothetical protein